MQQIVTVFGSAQAKPGSQAYEEARHAGSLLAQSGFDVCSGGYGGVMEAVSLGAKESGGATIGVTTDVFGSREPNRWVDQELRAPTFVERMRRLVEVGSGFLALKGGIGTLAEISLVWSLLQTRSIPSRPFVLLRDPWASLLDLCRERLIIRPYDFGHLLLCGNPEEAVRALCDGLDLAGR
jgi:uncharacterized protein (TIGR00730 family)